MGESSFPSASDPPELEPALLDEERVRDQLSAAEELHHLGHAEPAVVAAGAALAGVLRLSASYPIAHSGSAGELLEALHAAGAVSVTQQDLLGRLLRAHDWLARGFAPERALSRRETELALATTVQMLERLHS